MTNPSCILKTIYLYVIQTIFYYYYRCSTVTVVGLERFAVVAPSNYSGSFDDGSLSHDVPQGVNCDPPTAKTWAGVKSRALTRADRTKFGLHTATVVAVDDDPRGPAVDADDIEHAAAVAILMAKVWKIWLSALPRV
jgi:hypothetical protein